MSLEPWNHREEAGFRWLFHHLGLGDRWISFILLRSSSSVSPAAEPSRAPRHRYRSSMAMTQIHRKRSRTSTCRCLWMKRHTFHSSAKRVGRRPPTTCGSRSSRRALNVIKKLRTQVRDVQPAATATTSGPDPSWDRTHDKFLCLVDGKCAYTLDSICLDNNI